MNQYIEWFWPILEKTTKVDRIAQELDLKQDKLRINLAPWENNIETVLEEARRLNDTESERRKTADSKAGVYLAAITALSPVLVSLLPSIWGKDSSPSLNLVSLVAFFLATIYLLRAGLWAFDTLKVSASTRVDVKDLAAAWAKPDPQLHLARMLLIAVRLNHNGVNHKVSCIKMTHALLLRSFLAFVLLLIVQVSWTPTVQIVDWMREPSQQVQRSSTPSQ